MKLFKLLIRTNCSWSTLPVRIALGAIFIAHGSQKLFGWFGGYGLAAMGKFFEAQLKFTPGIFWAALAGGGEFFGGLMIFTGILTRFGASLISVVMLVAIFKVHFAGGFFLPNGMEYAFALLGMAVSLLVYGGGCLSIDNILSKNNDN